MKVLDLIEILNTQGFKTDYETEYTNGRGGYKLISATYARMKEKHGEYFANKLASTFIVKVKRCNFLFYHLRLHASDNI